MTVVLFFTNFCIPAFLLKDGVVNEGPNLGYILEFSTAFLTIGVSCKYFFMAENKKKREHEASLFNDDHAI